MGFSFRPWAWLSRNRQEIKREAYALAQATADAVPTLVSAHTIAYVFAPEYAFADFASAAGIAAVVGTTSWLTERHWPGKFILKFTGKVETEHSHDHGHSHDGPQQQASTWSKFKARGYFVIKQVADFSQLYFASAEFLQWIHALQDEKFDDGNLQPIQGWKWALPVGAYCLQFGFVTLTGAVSAYQGIKGLSPAGQMFDADKVPWWLKPLVNETSAKTIIYIGATIHLLQHAVFIAIAFPSKFVFDAFHGDLVKAALVGMGYTAGGLLTLGDIVVTARFEVKEAQEHRVMLLEQLINDYQEPEQDPEKMGMIKALILYNFACLNAPTHGLEAAICSALGMKRLTKSTIAAALTGAFVGLSVTLGVKDSEVAEAQEDILRAAAADDNPATDEFVEPDNSGLEGHFVSPTSVELTVVKSEAAINEAVCALRKKV